MYIIIASTGEWEDKREWIVGYDESYLAAEKYKHLAEQRQIELETMDDTPDGFRYFDTELTNKDDTKQHTDYTGKFYRVEETLPLKKEW